MSDFHDPNDGRRHRARLRRQQSYQASYREKLKKARTPERDDIAAACLRTVLAKLARDPRSATDLVAVMVEDLAHKGFARDRTADRVKRMVLQLRSNQP